MHITKLKIEGLFGRFNYSFSFNESENIFMFHGHNGAGKTQVLKIIETVCAKKFSETDLDSLRCSSVQITYSDTSILLIKKHSEEKETHKYQIYYGTTSKKLTLLNKQKTSKAVPSDRELSYLLSKIEDHPSLIRREHGKWMSIDDNKEYSLAEVINEFGPQIFPNNQLLEELKKVVFGLWDTSSLPEIKTDFLNTRRLDYTKIIERSSYSLRYREDKRDGDKNTNSLIKLAKNISDKIKLSSEDYSKTSQKLDALFLPEVLKVSDKNNAIKKEDVIRKLTALDIRVKELHEAGIIDEQQSNLSTMIKKAIPQNTKLLPVFDVHIRNTEKKLKVFDEIYEQISLLKEIINKRFKFKKIQITPDGITVLDTDTKNPIAFNSLSSGEQHELYLLASLIFYDNPPDIIFIDEPEISLHVAWQESFVNDLLKIKKLEKTQIMIATHSPSILGEHYDKAFDLNQMNTAK